MELIRKHVSRTKDAVGTRLTNQLVHFIIILILK